MVGFTWPMLPKPHGVDALSRYEALLRMSRAIAHHTSVAELLHAISDQLHLVVPFDYAKTGQLQTADLGGRRSREGALLIPGRGGVGPARRRRARVLLAVVGKFVERGAPVIYALPTDFGWKVVRLDEPR